MCIYIYKDYTKNRELLRTHLKWQEPYSVLCGDLNGSEKSKTERDICVPDSLYCTAEVNTNL